MTDTESDPEPDSSSDRPAPQTPAGSAKTELHTWSSSHHGFTTPKSSPPGSPSLGLYSLGMSPFSPARRHFPSRFSRSPSSLHETERSEQEDIIQDSKDVLVQRLNDLAAQLNQQDHLSESNVYGLHAKVDDMERTLSTRELPSRRAPWKSRPGSSVLPSSGSERESFWGPLTSGRAMPSIPNMPLSTQRSSSTQTENEGFERAKAHVAKERGMSEARVNQVVVEAQNLQRELEEVILSLRARQEESDHIHDMLITRAERAAQRIIYLEKRVKELESERNEGEMEMLNLQIQLKAIEVQCLSYVPKDADEELRESISTWKTEWSALKRKRARRRAGTGEAAGASTTPTRQPRNMTSPG